MTQCIFFDIDGTLLTTKGELPESAKEALSLAKTKGHKLCLATGRSKIEIPKHIWELEFDGWVLGSGAYVEYEGKKLFHDVFLPEGLQILTDFLEDHQAATLYEANDVCYATTKSKARIMDIFSEDDHWDTSLSKIFENSIKEFNTLEQLRDINKIAYFEAKCPMEEMIRIFSQDYSFIPNSIMVDSPHNNGEITKNGLTKAGGMKYILEHLNLKPEDSTAFGDGLNDIEMIQYAGTGVAMGNGSDKLKKVADITAPSISENGIYAAMKKLQLI